MRSPQNNPFIKPNIKFNPERPIIDHSISEIPNKLYIASPGGKTGKIIVKISSKKKDIANTNTFDIEE